MKSYQVLFSDEADHDAISVSEHLGDTYYIRVSETPRLDGKEQVVVFVSSKKELQELHEILSIILNK